MSTQEAVRHVEGEVRELIRRSGLDPASDTKAVRRLVQDAVQDYDERSLHGGLPSLGDQRLAVHSILAVVAGYGPLQQYFDDPAVEEIWINSFVGISAQVRGLDGRLMQSPLRCRVPMPRGLRPPTWSDPLRSATSGRRC